MSAGVLRWGVKRSFRAYVHAVDDAAEAVSGGADVEGDQFCFPRDPAASGLQFRGTATLSAYSGMLGVSISEPKIETEGESWVLSIRDPASRSVPPARRVICDLSPRHGGAPAGEVVLDARLAAAGTALFDGVYPAGTSMDPVTVSGADSLLLAAAGACS